MTIEEILAGESKNVEFKENLPEKSQPTAKYFSIPLGICFDPL